VSLAADRALATEHSNKGLRRPGESASSTLEPARAFVVREPGCSPMASVRHAFRTVWRAQRNVLGRDLLATEEAKRRIREEFRKNANVPPEKASKLVTVCLLAYSNPSAATHHIASHHTEVCCF
jgi:hypothetical protein